MASKVDIIQSKLEYYDDLYYNQNISEISDEEYDALKETYKELTGTEYVSSLGIANNSTKVKHIEKVLSLDKITEENEIREWLTKLIEGVITPKFDGISVVKYGHQGSTRGNGDIGNDITNNLEYIEIYNKDPETLNGVRGEVFFPLSSFEEINKEREELGLEPYKNARNAISGLVTKTTELDDNEKKWLSKANIVYYDLTTEKVEEYNKILNFLHRQGYNIPSRKLCFKFDLTNIDDAVEFILNYEENIRESLDFEIDGLVIRSSIRDSYKEYGVTSHHPLHSVAYKFKSKGEWTDIKDITWSVGRTGRVTPCAELSPINIMGSTISRATLNNQGYINALGIKQGSRVFVVKSKDVIPAILKSKGGKNVFKAPTECPVCGGKLDKEGDLLYCNNLLCKSKLDLLIAHMASTDALNIDGLSVETASKMVEAGLVKSPYQVFNLTIEDLEGLDGFANKKATNLYNAISKSKKGVSLERFIYACGIPLVGKSTSRDIAQYYGTVEELIIDVNTNQGKGLYEIASIGKKTVASILRYQKALAYMFTKIQPIPCDTSSIINQAMNDKEEEVAVAGGNSIIPKAVCVTGKFSFTRNDICVAIEKAGHIVHTSVKNTTDVLLCSKGFKSTKLEKATKLNKKIVYNLADLQNELGVTLKF